MSHPEIELVDPDENWAIREGYKTKIVTSWGSGYSSSSVYLKEDALQEIVNQAAVKYGIRAQEGL